jgi:excisionase family DNA binding protein
MTPDQLLDRAEACRALGISRQTLISWIQKGKLKVWKRVGHGSNAALLFERRHVELLRLKHGRPATTVAAS